jgi:molybdate transport system ATP-binding protein
MLNVDIEQRLGGFQLNAVFSAGVGLTTLFGRSGSGKTSIVNAIAGISRPARGRIEVNGEVLFDSVHGIDVPIDQRRVGYVFQEGRLFQHMSVRQNLLYGAFFAKQADRYASFERITALLGLEQLLARRPAALSGGEKQRVAIGRALLSSPRLLLMDEPLAALDVYRKSEILQYIELLRDEVRIPIIYVSHSVEEVIRLADTVVLVAEGRAIASGGVDEVMGRLDLRPHTGRYEAGAVIEAHVAAHDQRYGLSTLRFTGGELQVTSLDALAGEPVRVRVRSRDVSIALSRPQDISILNVLRGRVLEISADEGPIAEVSLDVGGTILLARVTRHSVDRLGLRVGQDVYALIKAVSLDRHSVGFA